MYEIFDKLLKEKGISAYKVSKETGVSTSTLSNWKNGEYVPKANKLQKIADYLDVSLEFLMTGKEDVNCLYTDENAEIMIKITEEIRKDKKTAERFYRYLSLMSDSKKSVDDMIDFMYEKENKGDN